MHLVDARDPDAVERTMRRCRPDTVVNASAYGAYPWQARPEKIASVNIGALEILLRAATRQSCSLFLQLGSVAERESPGMAQRPGLGDYARSKTCATQLVQSWSIEAGLPAVTVRLASVYGPWEDPRRLVPLLATCGLAGCLPPLAQASVTRDLVQVNDACAAILGARPSPGRPHILEVGGGRSMTLAELVAVAKQTLHIDAEPAWGSLRSHPRGVSMISAKPQSPDGDKRVPFKVGFRAFVDWLLADHNLYERYKRAALQCQVSPQQPRSI